MQLRSVVVTGLGVVSNIGIGIDAFCEGLRSGKRGTSTIEAFDTTGFASNQCGQIKDFAPSSWMSAERASQLGRAAQFCVAAAHMAVQDAGLSRELLSPARAGACIGTTEGEGVNLDSLGREWLDGGAESFSPSLARQAPAGRLAAAVAEEFGLTGEAMAISTACAAGNYAIGHAFDLISTGEADFMLAGGTDAMSRKAFAGFFRLGAIAPEVCRPFDKNRKGILTAEGSGVLVLETLESAQRRGATIYAEILGYGMNCDAKHMVAPQQESVAECMRIAHRNAGITPDQVDYVCAHGTGTKANDAAESGALQQVFGEHAPPMSSIKSMIGHAMGAASAIAAVACCLALRHQFMPPTINFQEAAPDCPVDCVPNQSREARLNIVQNDAFAFGGNNAIVLFKRTSTGQ